ncbi:MAG: shikimate kinase [Flavobacteriales bacterium]|nr:shikimate kinase [Flavobacteriales bacterium]MCB9173502.1 shikimate kinase [Flavobacteriales bacterium]
MNNKNNIFLVGFMGSGKSTLGKKLAAKLNMTFFDLDQLIEEKEGKTIAEIFSQHGETYFRDLETTVLKQTINQHQGFVLALGGGTPIFNNNMELVNQNGTSVYLKYNAGMLSSRLLTAKQQRPLIAGKNEIELKQFVSDLLTQREPYYLKSKLVVEGNNISANDILERLGKN